MNHAEPSAVAMARLKTLSLVVLGAMIPLVLDVALGLASGAETHAGWPRLARSIGMLAGCAMTMVIAYRMARYSRLPGAALILLLVAMVVATVALSHFS